MVEWIDLKLYDHVSIIIMHLPIKQIGQWMHQSREKVKMAEGDGGRFLENRALEFA